MTKSRVAAAEQPQADPGPYHEVGYLADHFSVSRATIYNWMSQGLLRFLKVGKARRIPESEIRAFAARHLVGGPQQ